jgi:two-component system sensor histidine kinase/response regulator
LISGAESAKSAPMMEDAGRAPSDILVVDDNEQNRSLAKASLEDEGYGVVLASGGEPALEAFSKRGFACVLLDVRMPGLDGFEVCRRMRDMPGGKETPIVFLTALRDLDTFDAALAAGGDDFLTKPLRPAELLVRVRAALELRRLGLENRGYYETIREQRDAMMRLQLQKEQLTTFLVHDLKNPVNALDLHAQLLLRDKTLPERAKTSAQAIRSEARRLTQLISNMLDISKGEAGELTVIPGEIDMVALAEELVSEFAVRGAAKNVTLRKQVEQPALHADPGLLRRVLENLLDNALRHSPEGSTVSLCVTGSADGVELRVSDQGSGVPHALREAVFERFVQGSAPAGGTKNGYGLGLAFCKLAVQAHGGAMWVEDGAPGAVFAIRLPAPA